MRTIVGTQGTTRKPLKAFKDLTKRHRDFIKAYVRSGDAEASYIQVGYKGNPKAAHKLHRDLSFYIAEELKKYVKGTELGIVGLNLVRKLAEESENDMVRLNAAKELLSRSLPDDPKEVHHTHTKDTLSDDQLLKRIEDLRNKLAPQASNVVNIDSKVVSVQ